MLRLLTGTLILICLLCCNSSLLAQTKSSETTRGEIELAILNLQFERASNQLHQLSSSPAHAAYYRLSISVYQFLATQDNQYFRQMRSNWKTYEGIIEKLSDTDPQKRLLLAEIHCKRAAVEFLKENYFTAVQYARSGRNYAIEQAKLFPQDPAINKVLGVFNAMFGAVPSRYLWLTETLGYEGDVQQGLKQLSLASQSKEGFMIIEADLFASYIEKIMLNQSQAALERLISTRKTKGKSAVVDYFSALAYMQNKQTEKALVLLQNQIATTDLERLKMPYWDYQLAKAYYYRGNYAQAYPYFKRFLETYKGELFRTDACFRLGMSYTLNGADTQGRRYFELINSGEDSGFDQDEYAAHLAKRFEQNTPSKALKDLFRARNYYDGGYFSKAEALLLALEQKSLDLNAEERTELRYRLGRLYHAQNLLSKAQTYYEASAQESVEEQKWLQAYAQYYLGEIAFSKALLPQAREYYEAALAYDDYWYQSGLENRCKSRLSEMKSRAK